MGTLDSNKMSYTLTNETASTMMSLSWEMTQSQWNWLQSCDPPNSVQGFFMDIKSRSQLTLSNCYSILLMAIIFGIYRYLLVRIVVAPIARRFSFDRTEVTKLNESAFKLSGYGFFYCISSYLVNVKYPRLQYDLATQWTEYARDMAVPGDIEFLFIAEAGFYFFAMYATWYLDLWKKDSIAMLVHHVLAIVLIVFSFAVRYHRIGLIVMYLHDGADVILEITMMMNRFKTKVDSIVSNRVLSYASNIGFVMFSYNWFWCRLVQYPQMVMFSAFYVSRKVMSYHMGSFYFTFNVMLSFLLLLNIFWFHFIVVLVLRILTGKTKDVEDTREY